MNTFDGDDRQPREEELLEEGMHFGKRLHRKTSAASMESMSYDAPMPVSPRNPASEWRSIVEEFDWTPTRAPPDRELVQILKKAFGGSAAAAILAGVSLYVTLAGYGGAGSKRSA